MAIVTIPKGSVNWDVPVNENFNDLDARMPGKKNLLDNWYFADPVNQRGQTSYDTHKSSAYGIDRWWSIFTSATIQQDGILIKTNADAAYAGVFRQAIGEAKQLAGKTVTLSFLLKEVSGTVAMNFSRATGVNAGMVVESPSVNTSSAGLLSVTGTLSQNVGSSETPVLLTTISCSQGGTYKIVAAKLELGDKQTLAHQENGNWVLNDPPPNKLIELLKCQYFYRLFATESARPKALADYHPPMRANPATGTIDINGVTYYYSDANL